jgi:predicted RNA-binding Zn-ribbon protein involved in translation (DUF1610 family)
VYKTVYKGCKWTNAPRKVRAMEVKFECPDCGQHLSATQSQVGATGPCPNCGAMVSIPKESTLLPSIPRPSPQPQQPLQNPQAAVVKRTKARGVLGTLFGIIVVIGAVAVGAWFVYDSSKPKLFAKVQVTPKVLRITNGNDTAWDSPTIILNDGFDGPVLDVVGAWSANETRELPLSDFRGRLNHQLFNPDYEKVHKVIIQADGFQLGIYGTQ